MMFSRSFATLKDIQLRLKSIKNIGKITKSMKMIASTKLNRAQKAMEVGRTFGQTSDAIMKYISDETTSTTQTTTTSPNSLFIACSSDRGLCGAIHSSVSKFVKAQAAAAPASTKIVILGDKAKPQIARGARRNILMSFNQVGKDIPTFTDALDISEKVIPLLTNNSESGNINASIVFNEFKSVIAYETVSKAVLSHEQLNSMPKLAAYEVDPSVLEGYAQFLLSSQIFAALVEGHAAEMSAKRMAMENASKNSDSIVLALTMQYNRTRQSVITNELVDIITGASAL